jgi:mannose-1-phosphate guanylyltransferase / mannose-6-phosphate isomerase
MNILPVILAGGSGTRLWPISRNSYPKQFLKIVGDQDQTLLQSTLTRLQGLDSDLSMLDPLIICNNEHRFLVVDQLHEVGIERATIILEPEGRNTAPAVALAAYYAEKLGDVHLLVLPADHHIVDVKAFQQAIIAAATLDKESLIAFGVVPTEPHTGYGYIKIERSTNKIQQFVEKPDQARAADYLKSGDYQWNSGMFFFSSSRYLEELKKQEPKICSATEAAWNGRTRDLNFIRVDADLFSSSPSNSIDYAVMEKIDHGVAVSLDVGWNDMGDWAAVQSISAKDSDRNALWGDVHVIDTSDSLVYGQNHMIATIGIQGLIVVDTLDALLIATKERAQEVKQIAAMLHKEGRGESCHHLSVHRPWGTFQIIDQGQYFQVKRITVNPGSGLSLQLHNHRTEHWVVVQGEATVVNGEDDLKLSKGQSTYIPMQVKHRLRNLTDEPLEIIEVQSGEYLGEDDIVRFDDDYGRTE